MINTILIPPTKNSTGLNLQWKNQFKFTDSDSSTFTKIDCENQYPNLHFLFVPNSTNSQTNSGQLSKHNCPFQDYHI